MLLLLKQGWVLGIQFRTGYQNQAKYGLEQCQVSGGPVAHAHQNFCSVPPPPRGFPYLCYEKYELLM